MVCTAVAIQGSSSAMAARDLRREGARVANTVMRRSQSAPQLRCSLAIGRAAAPPSLKTSWSVGLFPIGSVIASTIQSLLFETEEAGSEMRLVYPLPEEHEDEKEEEEEEEEEEALTEDGQEKQANWVSRILVLSHQWRERQNEEEEEEDAYCQVSYDDSEEEVESANRGDWNRESFERLLGRVGWSDTKLFSQLAYLCNQAYSIQDIKRDELRAWHNLEFVTSSFEKKSEAAIRAQLEIDSTRPPQRTPKSSSEETNRPNTPVRSSLPYEIAAFAASYVHSRAKGLFTLDGGDEPQSAGSDEALAEAAEATAPPSRAYNSEVAAYVAASTMTAVAAAEEARQEATKDLRSLHSAPCEWFVCDDQVSRTRCFVIQGSDSLASWQANLSFEPTKFENTGVLVHRGIYEAAKGIYEQVLPEIEDHLRRYGDRAKFRFTGHSLGGSLGLLVALMLLARGDVKHHHLHRVVTFGAPSVFCGGQSVLKKLGLDDGFVRSVVMHRDIVPRVFSCMYPNHVAHVLKRLSCAFRSHPCLNNQNQKLLYTPLGQTYILQPDDKSSPVHPLLPPEPALYVLDGKGTGQSSSKAAMASALRAFINSPHPLETLSDPRAYSAILRDHDSSNYARAINDLVRQQYKLMRRRSRKQRRNRWWPLLTTLANRALLPCHLFASLQNSILGKAPSAFAVNKATTRV